MKIKRRYYFLLFCLALMLLRGPIFRGLVTYEPVRQRIFDPLDEMHEVSRSALAWAVTNKNAEPEDVIRFTLAKTAHSASFSFTTAGNEANQVYASGKANCVGYARFFAALLNHADQQNRLRAEVVVGKLSLLGYDLHRLTNDPFWRDHDYVRVADTVTGEVLVVDPSLYDYSRVVFIREVVNEKILD